MCKVNCPQTVDYIFCLSYWDEFAVETNFQAIEVTDTTISCNLSQRQRSSQQILDLADYLQMHMQKKLSLRRYNSKSSFSAEIPLWIELTSPKSFFNYFNVFECKDVMLMWDSSNEPSNLNDIKSFCAKQKWRCTSRSNAVGSEALVTILYDLKMFDYEDLTRAKTQLIVVTIYGRKRYVPF